MRLVGVLPEEKLAFQFSNFLTKEGIENHLEASQAPEDKKISYAVWVIEEDQFEKAHQCFEEFQRDPQQPKFQVSATPPPPPSEKKSSESSESEPVELKDLPRRPRMRYTFTMTGLFIMICVVVYFLNSFQELKINNERGIKRNFLFTPIQKALMYDFPLMFEKLESLIEKERIDLSKPSQPLPPELSEQIASIEQNNPYWKGLYTLALHTFSKGKVADSKSEPLFEKISQGQVWRVFSPCILHRDLLHILFNMIWLWVLGKQLDLRLNKVQYLLLVLIIGILSNTGQYLMSGPLFMGFSGVITGMAGFIWVRQKIAPWEGYSVHRSTFIFLAFFIGVMFVLQAISFVYEWMTGEGFSVSIANTAHIAGAIIGMILARIPWFAWRPKNER